jgi:molybdopterin-containing oxidoreductase family iron-sulfur binding subunit
MPPAPITRRDFIRIAVATGGLAGAGIEGCGSKDAAPERLVPASSPEAAPGVAAEYATLCRECPAGCGAIARHRDGRVTKLEGNPDHPISRGALCARGQAAVLGLYDPDRVRTPLVRRPGGGLDPISWDEALGLAGERLARARAAGSGRIALLSALDSGSLSALEGRWIQAFGSSRYLLAEPFGYEALRAAMELTFGVDQVPRFDLTRATYVLALGADFLDTWISPVQMTREFAALRSPEPVRRTRCHYFGPRLTLTAAAADQRTYVRGSELGLLGMALVSQVLAKRRTELDADTRERLSVLLRPLDLQRVAEETGVPPAMIETVTDELLQADAPVVLAGSPLAAGPPDIAAATAALLLNRALGAAPRIRPHALGRTARPPALLELAGALGGGEIDVVLVREIDPVFAGGPLGEIGRVLRRYPGPGGGERPWVIALASALDDTAARADLVLPVHTPLEAWGDAEPEPGIASLQQPAMGPLYDSRHAGDVLLGLAGAAGNDLAPALGVEDFRGYLRARWSERHEARGEHQPFEAFFAAALRRGGVFEPRASVRFQVPPFDATRLPAGWDGSGTGGEGERPAAGPISGGIERGSSEVELHVFPSNTLFDGRGANRGWLQELADPVTKVAWNTWIEAHPETAGALGLADGDRVRIRSDHGEITAPLLVHPDCALGVLAVPAGQGHEAYGRLARGRGANPFRLLAPDLAMRPGLIAERHGRAPKLARYGGPADPEGRSIVPLASLAGPDAATEDFLLPLPESYDPVLDTVVPHPHREHRWGMVIDLEACTGCSACVTACYAENNIPVVGEENVREGREMAWITLQRYDVRHETHPWPATTHAFLPMLCQQCDSAPCEAVCPTFASYHTEEGLNAQVYPRCIGTRYCANNCPYKVRRFNWHPPSFASPLHLQLNPDVTRREKGVVEKCTFCVQRITAAKQAAARAARPLVDGEVVPACVATCPATAIVFGDLLDPAARVSELMRSHPRRYQVLGELRTRPAVVYLERIRRDHGAG